MKKIIHWKLSLLVILVLPIVVFTLLTSRFEIYGMQTFVVLTGSMNPSIPQGSVVYTKAKPEYSIGDVVTYNQENVVVTHRVVDVTSEGYITQGDANDSHDSRVVAREDVLGSSLFSVPYVGSFISYIQTFEGFVLFVIVPGVLFILFELWNIKNHIVEHTKKKTIEEMKVL